MYFATSVKMMKQKKSGIMMMIKTSKYDRTTSGAIYSVIKNQI